MTIKQYAAQHKVSPQAVYQRLKKNKIRVETLTENGTGELTGEGIVVLDKLFNPENRAIKPLKDEKIEALEAQLAAFKAENAVLQTKVDSLTDMVGILKQSNETYIKLLEQEREQNLEMVKRLPAGPSEGVPGKRSFWHRLTGRGKV